MQRGRARSTTGRKARSGQWGCWPVPPAKHRGSGGPYILQARSAAYCLAPGTAFLRDTWEQEQPTTKMHHSHSCYTYKKITALCYSRRFACCKTIVINHRPISAAILKFALPGVVMFQPFFLLHFFFFLRKIKPVQSHFNITGSHRQHSSSPSQGEKADTPQGQSTEVQLPPSNLAGDCYVSHGVLAVLCDLHHPTESPARALKNAAGPYIFSTASSALPRIKHRPVA